jgi:hypothetical protein
LDGNLFQLTELLDGASGDHNMPRFYFHYQRGGVLAADDEGQDLPSFEEANEAARISTREILADDIKHGETTPLDAVMIANDRGQTLATIHAKDILRVSK